MKPRALLFDVFGTVVDWRSSVALHVTAAFAEKGLDVDGAAFADAWRAEYQPSMERVRSGERDYAALDDLHRENLMTVLAAQGHARVFEPSEIMELGRAWERLEAWPDAPAGLARLRAHRMIAPCSNGSIALMTRLARHAGLPWDCVLGADIARAYKPDAAVYLASCAALRLAPEAVMMVAAHNDDLAAARAAGLTTAFVPRPREHGTGQRSDLAAEADWDVVAADFGALADALG